MSESDEQTPDPQISPDKPGDGPRPGRHREKDKLSRSDSDDEHRESQD